MGSSDTKHNRVYGRQIGSCRYITALFLSIPFRGNGGGVPHRYRASTVRADTYVRSPHPRDTQYTWVPLPTLMRERKREREREREREEEKRDGDSNGFILLLM